MLLLLACAACSATGRSDHAVGQAPVSPPAPDLAGQMRQMIGAAACTDASQCRTVPFGARACGGPEAYLAYSTSATGAAPLQALAERYARQRRAQQAAANEASTCQFVADPGAQCRAGACVVNSAGSDAR